MTSQEIRAAIAASSDLRALADVRNDGAIAAALSVGRTKIVSKIITSRGISSAYAGGALASENVLMKLEGAYVAMLASSDASTKVLGSLLRRQLGFLAGDGLDFGDATLRGMLDQFALMGILTSGEVANLKNIARGPDPVSADEVSAALNAGV